VPTKLDLRPAPRSDRDSTALAVEQAPVDSGGGELLRCLYAGGDQLYGLPVERVGALLAASDRLILHYSSRNKRDHQRLTVLRIAATFIGLCFLSLLVLGLFHTNRHRDLLRVMFFYSCGLSGLVAIGVGIRHQFGTLNYGWEVSRNIDFVSREVISTIRTFGKRPEFDERRLPFDQLALVCHVNYHWESGPTLDLSLVEKDQIPASRAEYDRRLCSLLMFPDPPDGTIPAEVMNIVDGFVARTGALFVDLVHEPRVIRERRATADGAQLAPLRRERPSRARRRARRAERAAMQQAIRGP
jgi:hypothetical protein